MSGHHGDSGSASETLTPGRRERKRVGFHARSGQGDLYAGDDAWPLSSMAPPTPPRFRPGELPPNAPDAHELSRALTKVLSEEQERDRQLGSDADRHPTSSPPQALSAPVTPGRPRPALRRNTSYDADKAREEADRAEQQANPRQLRSLTDARQRADRLAVSLGSHSAPGSRRNSDEVEASFQFLVEDTDGHDDDPEPPVPSPTVVSPSPPASQNLRQRISSRYRSRSRSRQRRRAHDQAAAEELVRSHTGRDSRSFFYPQQTQAGFSGTSTPVMQQAYAEDYVSRPDRYRGGILSTLLKLYNDDRAGHDSSGQTTPVSPPSPARSPIPSPSSSRRPSLADSVRSRTSSGIFSSHRSQNSSSSVTLTELIKSSSMLSAPGSGEISDKVGDKIRKDSTSKSSKEQHRITIHIADIMSRHRYLMKLCRALMMYGAPTHRLEEYMTMSARVLEIEGQFLYIPSCMIISFDDATTHTTEVKIVRVPHGIDLGRLRDVHNVYKDVVHDKLGVEEATRRIDHIMKGPPRFPTWFRVLMYGVASACVAPFAFEGRFIDLPFAFVLGCLLGIMQLVFAPSNELYAHVFEVSAAIVTSFIARAFGSIQGGKLFCFSALAQSSIALILPGYIVLCSSLELQSHNLVAGSVRMVYAMIYTLFLGYGITIGASLYGVLDSNATSDIHCDQPLHRGWYFLFVPGFTMCLCIINQAKWKQTPVMLVMALAGFCVNSYTSQYFDGTSQISNMLGALTVGILANLYSRLGRHAENAWLDFLEWWELKVRPRISRKKSRMDMWPKPTDPESRPGSPDPPVRRRRQAGYSLAAAAMLPAIFVQVPSGLAAGGSLLAGITSADHITANSNKTSLDAPSAMGNLDGTAFNVLFSVIQVAIGLSVGLFMSALIVYPLGKRRSGLFSF